MTTALRDEDYDALAPETFDSPYALYADLRGRCPVAYSRAWNGFWSVLRYADVAAILADPNYVTSVQNVVPKLAFTGRRPPLHLDPPEHTPYRNALNPLMRPERVAALEGPTRAFAAELLAPMVAKGGGDICAEFSSHLPVRVFGAWMNLPQAQLDVLHDAGRAFNIAVQAFDDEAVKATSLALYDMARALIAERKARPLDPKTDPTSALLAARYRGEALPDEMIVGTVRQVLVVGIIAPTVLIGSICVHLSRHPDLQARLRAEPELMGDAVEEFLRLYTPYRGFARTAKTDVEIAGRKIAKDEPIALVYASANRDEAVFERADEFILNRPNIRDHLAFGRGPHQCLGMPLARLELKVALEELLARTPGGFELAGEIRPTRCPEIGALSVPLRFLDPAA
ncbi:cytochrome P450 [Phenylobacterium terrae]|uniref:Cytochrome P450 n=1 Tax=Phenylobacterium terrae TaxID=2665495 RepID=A0ABW4MXJ7_9CAUL